MKKGFWKFTEQQRFLNTNTRHTEKYLGIP